MRRRQAGSPATACKAAAEVSTRQRAGGPMPDPTSLPPSSARARRIGLTVVFLWFLIGGIAHFVATDTEVRLVPPYVPWPLAAVWVSGIFELLGAGGLLFARTRRPAGIGLFVLTLCVTPVHFYMLQRPDLFAVPYWALVLRLPLQGMLLALIAWSTCWRGRSGSSGDGPSGATESGES
jgi:uncharacterized membrane protein